LPGIFAVPRTQILLAEGWRRWGVPEGVKAIDLPKVRCSTVIDDRIRGETTMALGEQVGHATGQITGTRVLPPSEQGEPRVEVSFEARGRLLDEDIVDMGTYVSVLGKDGVLRGTGQGCTMSRDGETLVWEGTGIGKLLKDGATSFRGSIFYRTTSERFSRLNSTAVVFEYDADASGKTEDTTYEWK
jgi:hypothetical protein